MVESVESETEAVGRLHPGRFKVYKLFGKLSNIIGDNITENMAVHKKSLWNEYIKGLEELAMECFPSKSDSASYKQAHMSLLHAV